MRNVVDFGAFVDVGVGRDGLWHKSIWPPVFTACVGWVGWFEVLDVEVRRERLSLAEYVPGSAHNVDIGY